MTTTARVLPGTRFFDSRRHAPAAPAELFIVEGDSAALAVAAVRNEELQAVLPLQGKPMNAARVSRARLATSPWLGSLTAVLGDAPGTSLPLGDLRYQRILLLGDPDADGIHASALMQIFFLECMPSLLQNGQVEIIHAPWGELRIPGEPPLLSFSADQFQRQSRELNVTGTRVDRIRYRGLGTITPAVLAQTCIDPTTRRSRVLSMADAQLALRVFGSAPELKSGG